MMFLNARHHKVSTFGHFRSSGDSGRFVLFCSPEIRLLSANRIHVWAGSKQVPFHTHEKLGCPIQFSPVFLGFTAPAGEPKFAELQVESA